MFVAYQVLTVILVAVAMALALAHALEWPGKRRLGREQYLAVQAIYYPGFTMGGASEPAGMLAMLGLLLMVPAGSAPFWLTLGALLALAAAHLIFWIITQPVNRHWLRETELTASAERFFGTGRGDAPADDWTALRDRWERSHMLRSGAAMLSLVLLVTAVAI